MEPITLSGQHVRLVPLTPDHASGLLAAAAGDRSTFTYTWVPDGDDDVRRYLAKALADQAAGTALPFATTRSQRRRGDRVDAVHERRALGVASSGRAP